MPRWNVRERQRIIDQYLNATGRNMFVPREFLDWLRPQDDHPLHETFFGTSDEEWAQQAREDYLRRWVSGLRIEVRYSEPKTNVVDVVVREQPLFVSPVGGRRSGGGYVQNDGSDADVQAELRRQAAAALDSWLGRFAGVAEAAGADLDPIKEIAALLAGNVAAAA